MAADRLGERELQRRWLDRLTDLAEDRANDPGTMSTVYLPHGRHSIATGDFAAARGLLRQATGWPARAETRSKPCAAGLWSRLSSHRRRATWPHRHSTLPRAPSSGASAPDQRAHRGSRRSPRASPRRRARSASIPARGKGRRPQHSRRRLPDAGGSGAQRRCAARLVPRAARSLAREAGDRRRGPRPQLASVNSCSTPTDRRTRSAAA